VIHRVIPFLPRKTACAAAVVLLALTLAGCGRRGALEPPPGADLTSSSVVPTTPSLDAAASEGGATNTVSHDSSEPATPAKPKPATRKPFFNSFFLDPWVN
jgi:predicted small lipoprotein YifL